MALGEMVLPLEPEQEDVAWSSWVLGMDGAPDKPSASGRPRPAGTPLSHALQKGAVLCSTQGASLLTWPPAPCPCPTVPASCLPKLITGIPVNKVCDCYLKQMERGKLTVFQEGGRE